MIEFTIFNPSQAISSDFSKTEPKISKGPVCIESRCNPVVICLKTMGNRKIKITTPMMDFFQQICHFIS